MPKLSPRLGYYLVSLGTVIQFLGLSGGSWLSNSNASRSGSLSFSHPGDVMLVIGMAVSVLGVILGFISLAETMPNEAGRTPRLLPALPLVLLVGLSIGSVSFAFQASGNSSNAAQAAGPSATVPATAFVVGTPGPGNCPEGTLWHPVMGHCMTPEAIAALENAKCPEGYALDPNLLTCLPTSAGTSGPGTPTTSTGGANTHVCPIGFFWHPAMNHCMETSTVVCPTGYSWSTSALSCVAPSSGGTITPPPNQTPSCPDGTFWHPVMNHCMSNTCPPGFQFDYTYDTCLQVARPTSTPSPSGTPQPTATTTPPTDCPPYLVWDPARNECVQGPTPTPTPVSQDCPDGFFWHPDMGHCMSNTCPPGLVFDQVTLYCVLPGTESTPPATTPTPVPTVTPAPLPECPDGFFWHPDMGHCMSNTCPPGLVFDVATLYCVLPGSESTPTPVTPTPTPTPTSERLPECPDGFFWHPDMGHCMSNTCPPGLVFDNETLYCVLPDS